MVNKEIIIIKKEIDKANNIALFTHTSPDCDGIGSMCAFYQYLKENSKNVSMFCDSDISEKYKFLDNFNKININELKTYDLCISLDAATSNRLGKYEEIFLQNNNINIDHHIGNNNFAKINYVKPNYSSCGEVLFEILKEFKNKIDESIATSLFAAISADTNQFSNANVSSRTYNFVGELFDLGADTEKVNRWLHKYKTVEQLRLAGFMASNLKYINGISYILIKAKSLRKIGVKSSDISNFLTLITDVGDTKITFVLKEREKGIFRVNFRSIGNYDVGRIATNFGGGGHKNASGCNIYGRTKDVIKLILKECNKEIKKNEE